MVWKPKYYIMDQAHGWRQMITLSQREIGLYIFFYCSALIWEGFLPKLHFFVIIILLTTIQKDEQTYLPLRKGNHLPLPMCLIHYIVFRFSDHSLNRGVQLQMASLGIFPTYPQRSHEGRLLMLLLWTWFHQSLMNNFEVMVWFV